MCISCMLILLYPSSVQANDYFDVTGYLEIGSNELDPVIYPELRLTTFKLGDQLSVQTTQPDGDGVFSFNNIIGGTGFGYIISAEYGDVTYTYESDFPIKETPVKLLIFENINSSEYLHVISHSMIVSMEDFESRTINVIELVEIENIGDRTFVPDLRQPGKMDLLRFSLPSGVENLDVQSSMRGGQILQVDRGFAITTPVKPGIHEIAYNFDWIYSGNSVSFDHGLSYGAEKFRVMLENGVGLARGTDLAFIDDITLGNKEYSLYETDAMDKGSRVLLELENLPTPSLWRQVQDLALTATFRASIIAGVFCISLVLLLIYYKKNNNKAVTRTQLYSEDEHSLIIEEIASLDERYENGIIDTDEYQLSREELINKILASVDPLSMSEIPYSPINSQNIQKLHEEGPNP